MPTEHPRERTGVRFVLTNAADPSRAADYSAWYSERGIIRRSRFRSLPDFRTGTRSRAGRTAGTYLHLGVG
jgi:hypothetical protein